MKKYGGAEKWVTAGDYQKKLARYKDYLLLRYPSVLQSHVDWKRVESQVDCADSFNDCLLQLFE